MPAKPFSITYHDSIISQMSSRDLRKCPRHGKANVFASTCSSNDEQGSNKCKVTSQMPLPSSMNPDSDSEEYLDTLNYWCVGFGT